MASEAQGRMESQHKDASLRGPVHKALTPDPTDLLRHPWNVPSKCPPNKQRGALLTPSIKGVPWAVHLQAGSRGSPVVQSPLRAGCCSLGEVSGGLRGPWKGAP